MSENSFSLMLRNLSNDYYHNHISFEDYRIQRKIILDKIDEEFNGTQPVMIKQADNCEQETSIFMQTISFMKNSDVDP